MEMELSSGHSAAAALPLLPLDGLDYDVGGVAGRESGGVDESVNKMQGPQLIKHENQDAASMKLEEDECLSAAMMLTSMKSIASREIFQGNDRQVLLGPTETDGKPEGSIAFRALALPDLGEANGSNVLTPRIPSPSDQFSSLDPRKPMLDHWHSGTRVRAVSHDAGATNGGPSNNAQRGQAERRPQFIDDEAAFEGRGRAVSIDIPMVTSSAFHFDEKVCQAQYYGSPPSSPRTMEGSGTAPAPMEAAIVTPGSNHPKGRLRASFKGIKDPKRGVNPRPTVKTILRRKFSWKNYPELEAFLIANREEYLRHSALNYTVQQKQYNNLLTKRLLELAAEHGYVFDEDAFNFVTVRDRIRCYFKSYVQSSKKRGIIIGYAARRAGLMSEQELEESAQKCGKVVVPHN